MIWRYGILATLHKWGIGGHLFKYIENFLQDRTFNVMVGGSTSQTLRQENGVCQGSIIAVNLFLIGINSLLSCVHEPVKAMLYADDLVIIIQGKNLLEMRTTMQENVTRMENWSNENGLTFSSEKTSAIVFSRRRRQTTIPPINLFNLPIKFCSEQKFLGLTFDRRLSWNQHIKNIHSQCMQKLKLLRLLAHREWGSSRSSRSAYGIQIPNTVTSRLRLCILYISQTTIVM